MNRSVEQVTSRRRKVPAILLLLVLLVLAAQVRAQAPDFEEPRPETGDAVEMTEFVVDPAPAPEPLLKYRLVTGPLEVEEGDAAPLYEQAAKLLQEDEALADQIDEAFGAGAPIGLAADVLASDRARKVLDLAVQAARRREWTFDLPLWTPELLTLPLDNLGSYRRLTRLIALKVRAEGDKGNFESAVRHLRAGYAMAEGLLDQPVLIYALVGMAVRAGMDATLAELLQRQDASNFYWALAEVPSAYRAIRRSMEYEMLGLFNLMPGLRDPEKLLAAPEQWAEQSLNLAQMLETFTGKSSAFLQASMLTVLSKPAVEHLMETRDMHREEVQAMPIQVVVGLHLRDLVLHYAHRATAAMALPYPGAAPMLEKLDRDLTDPPDSLADGMMVLFVPALIASPRVAASCDRRTAALMTVEALRMHAAETGHLPEKLADVEIVPVPDDPMSGEPFDYALVEGAAFLRSPDAPGERPSDTINYHIRLREQ